VLPGNRNYGTGYRGYAIAKRLGYRYGYPYRAGSAIVTAMATPIATVYGYPTATALPWRWLRRLRLRWRRLRATVAEVTVNAPYPAVYGRADIGHGVPIGARYRRDTGAGLKLRQTSPTGIATCRWASSIAA